MKARVLSVQLPESRGYDPSHREPRYTVFLSTRSDDLNDQEKYERELAEEDE